MRLVTSRLVLRGIVPSDADVLWSWRGEPGLPAQTLPGLRRFIRDVRRVRLHHQFMALAEGKAVGLFRLYERGLSDADIGGLVVRSAWGRGYGTEAAQALLRFGFTTLRLHRIWATTERGNRAAARVLEKIGMKREGVMREHRFRDGRWRDSVLYAIVAVSSRRPTPASSSGAGSASGARR